MATSEPKARGPHHSPGRQTELRRASAQVGRRLAKEAAEREWRLFLTAKFDRTWKPMTRFRSKVGATRFRELMTELPSTIESAVVISAASLSSSSSSGRSSSARTWLSW